MKVTKEITFDSAHMLSNYDGKCSNLHGHTYKLQVTLDGRVDPLNNMVVDFNVLKEILNETVMNKFDHAIIFSNPEFRNEAEDDLYTWAELYGKNYVVIPNGKTTCENIAPYIKQLISNELVDRNINASVYVRLWETPTSFAEC